MYSVTLVARSGGGSLSARIEVTRNVKKKSAPEVHPAVSEHMSKLGRKGGSTTGKSKLRGGPEYYRKAVNARWKKAAGKDKPTGK